MAERKPKDVNEFNNDPAFEAERINLDLMNEASLERIAKKRAAKEEEERKKNPPKPESAFDSVLDLLTGGIFSGKK